MGDGGGGGESARACSRRLPGGAPDDLRIQPLPWSAAHEKLLTGFAGGSLPDLGQVGNSWIAELTAIGAILPVPAAMQSLVEGQFAGVVDTNRIDGRLMALPWYVDTRLQFYRKDLFEAAGFAAPPAQWDEWKRALHAVKRRQGGEGFAILLPINEYEHLTQMALSAGATLPQPARHARGVSTARVSRRRWRSTSRSMTKSSRRSPGRRRFRNVWNEFARGYFAVYPSGPWTIGDMKSRLPAEPPVELGDRALPRARRARAIDPGRVEPGRLSSGARSRRGVGAGRAAGRPRRRRPSSQELTGDLPPSRAVWASAGLTADPITDAFARQLDRTAALPKVPEWERIVDRDADRRRTVRARQK